MPAKEMYFYAVFEKIQDPIVTTSISINKYVNVRTVDYKTTITFTALTNSMPEGARVVWYKDGQRAGTGETFTVADAREAFTVQARIVDDSGNTLNSTETELVKVKTDFLSKIIAFFRMLFGKIIIKMSRGHCDPDSFHFWSKSWYHLTTQLPQPLNSQGIATFLLTPLLEEEYASVPIPNIMKGKTCINREAPEVRRLHYYSYL